jgi:hypothetical protein
LSPPSELCFKCPPGSRRCPHSNPAPRLNLLSDFLCPLLPLPQPRRPYGAASGNRQRRQHREIVAAVLRQLVCDLCGDSQGAQQGCYLCGVSPYCAACDNQ